MRNSFAVIGSSDFISGFKVTGGEIYKIDDPVSLPSVFQEVANMDFFCIFIEEECARKIMNIIRHYAEKPYPLIIPVAGKETGDVSLTEQILTELTIKAVGKDIVS